MIDLAVATIMFAGKLAAIGVGVALMVALHRWLFPQYRHGGQG